MPFSYLSNCASAQIKFIFLKYLLIYLLPYIGLQLHWVSCRYSTSHIHFSPCDMHSLTSVIEYMKAVWGKCIFKITKWQTFNTFFFFPLRNIWTFFTSRLQVHTLSKNCSLCEFACLGWIYLRNFFSLWRETFIHKLNLITLFYLKCPFNAL